MLKLNLGCGTCKLKGYVNIDINPDVKPDAVGDFTKRLEYEDGSVDEVLLFHVIEHVEEVKHKAIFDEIWRVLKPDGILTLAYPEFIRCAQNYIDNKFGNRTHWAHTIYGRQTTKSDYHVALMYTPNVVDMLECCGFVNLVVKVDAQQDINTIVRAVKGPRIETREDLLKQEYFTYGGIENALREA